MGRRVSLRVRLEPLWPTFQLHSLCPLNQAQTYVGAEAVSRSDLVDVIGMGMATGAPGSGLALAPTHGPAMHHTAGCRASLVLLTAHERVAVVRHDPGGEAGGSKESEPDEHSPGPSCRLPS